MFEKFGDYMFSLLHAPLKRVKKSVNQFYIFFHVVGKLFDQCKRDVFRLREESAILTCDDRLLPVHGQDRDMARLQGETLENYRTRLAMKGIVAETAGSNEGIRYLARSLGYDGVEIVKNPDPARWAEATVTFIGGQIVVDDADILSQELNKIKRARTLLTVAKEQRYTATICHGSALMVGREFTIEQE